MLIVFDHGGTGSLKLFTLNSSAVDEDEACEDHPDEECKCNENAELHAKAAAVHYV